jgi:hypothetical protein
MSKEELEKARESNQIIVEEKKIEDEKPVEPQQVEEKIEIPKLTEQDMQDPVIKV